MHHKMKNGSNCNQGQISCGYESRRCETSNEQAQDTNKPTPSPKIPKPFEDRSTLCSAFPLSRRQNSEVFIFRLSQPAIIIDFSLPFEILLWISGVRIISTGGPRHQQKRTMKSPLTSPPVPLPGSS